MHDWVLIRLALLFLMFGGLLAVAIVGGIRAKRRGPPNGHAPVAQFPPAIGTSGAPLTHVRG